MSTHTARARCTTAVSHLRRLRTALTLSVVGTILASTALIGTLAQAAPAGLIEHKLQVGDATSSAEFGFAVAIDGECAIVGARNAGVGGRAYIFERRAGAWVQTHVIVPPNLPTGAEYGFSVDIDGDTAIVGARSHSALGTGAGAAYVWVREGSWWVMEQQLFGSHTSERDRYGTDVAVHNDVAMVGAPDDAVGGVRAGTAYVFTRSGSTWSQQARLAEGTTLVSFGYSVDIKGDSALGTTAIVGAPYAAGAAANSGAAYVFTRSGGSWSLQHELHGASSTTGDRFGWSVAMNDAATEAIVGAPQHTTAAAASGAAYAFRSSGSTWVEERELNASEPRVSEWLGYSVALSAGGDVAIVGAPRTSDHPNTGRALVFTHAGGSWPQQFELEASDGQSWDYFGTSVDVTDDIYIAGASQVEHPLAGGAAYVYEVPGPDLRIAKSGSPDPVAPGSELFYTLTVTNLSDDVTASSVVVTDTLPSEVSYIADSGGCSLSSGSGPDGEDQLTCALPDLAPGAADEFEIKTRVSGDAALGQVNNTIVIENVATVRSDGLDDNPADNSVTDRTIVEALVDLVVEKRDSRDPVPASSLFQYSITARNRSVDATATSVLVTDTLPSGVTYVDDTAGCTLNSGTGPAGADQLVCDLADLPPGGERSFQIGVQADRCDVGQSGSIITVQNVAEISCAECGDGNAGDANPADNTVTEGTFIDCDFDLAVSKSDYPDPAVAGERTVYTVSVSNTSSQTAAADVQVQDVLPPGSQYIGDTAGCTYDAGAGSSGEDVLNSCNLGDVAPGETGSFDITVRWPADFVAATATGTTVITNTARVCDYSGGGCATFPDSDASNNVAVEGTFVADKADLRVVKFSKPDTAVRAGEVFTYTIYVENLGPSAARNVSLRDEILSSGDFSLVDCTLDPSLSDAGCFTVPAPGGGLSLEADLREPLAPLGVEGQGRWTIQVAVRAEAAQDVNNKVTVFTRTTDRSAGATVTGTPDPDPSNNVSMVFLHVSDSADLEITKSSSPSVIAGDQLTYYLTVQNNGPSAAANVIVEDYLDRRLSVVSIDGTSFTPGATVTCVPGTAGDASDPARCVFSTMEDGDFALVTIEALVPPDLASGAGGAPVLISNSASARSDAFDPNLPNSLAEATTTVAFEADLAVSKTATPDPVVAGRRIAYQVTVSNNGPSAAHSVVVTDVLDGDVSAVAAALQGAEGSCVLVQVEPQQVRCNLASLAPGQTANIQVLGDVDAAREPSSVGPPLHNEVSVTSEQVGLSDPDAGNNSFTVDTDVGAVSQLVVDKTAADASPVAGGDLVYTVTARNLGPSTAKNVLLVDELASTVDVLYVSDSRCVVGAGQVSCAIADMDPLEAYTVDIHVRLQAGAPCGQTLVNSAYARWDLDNDPATGTDGREEQSPASQAKVTTDCVSDLRIRKYGKPDGTVRAGETLRYTMVVDNLGPSWAPAVSIKDILESSGDFTVNSIESDRPMTCTTTPAGPPPISADGRFLADCTLDERLEVLSASGEDVNPGRWILTLELVALQSQDIDNTATATSEAKDPDESNNQAYVEHEITAVADLVVSKLGPSTAVAGEHIEYTLEIANSGPSEAENAVLFDRLPSGITVTSAAVVDAEGEPSGECATGTPGEPLDKLVCGLGSMPAGGERTVTVAADVGSYVPAGAVLENDAYVTSDNFDDDNSNNFDHTLTTVVSEADLTVMKVAQPATATAGSPLQYLITVGNSGPSDAADVVVVDELPSGVSFRRAEVTVGAGSCLGLPSGDVTCQLGSLAVGATAQIAIEVLVDPAHDCAQDLVNTVTVTSPSDEDGAAFTLTTPIECSADLEITKTATPQKQDAGRQVMYTVSIENHGPSQAANVVVSDTLPPQVTYELDTDSCTVTGTDPITGGQVLLCTVGSLAPRDSTSFAIWARLDPSTAPGDTITNEACASSDTPDPNETNNCVSSDVFVEGEADLHVSKYGKPDGNVRAGEILTYTVIIDNLGPSWARGVSLKDIVESSGEFELLDVTADRSMACTFEPNGGTPDSQPSIVDGRLQIDCSLVEPLQVLEAVGFPNPGRWILTLTLQARQDQDINNTADVLSTAADPDPSNNHAQVHHEITAVSDLLVQKDGPSSVVAGMAVEYTLTVTNDGPSEAENVLVLDRLPAGIVVTSVTATDNGGAPAGRCTTGEAGNVFDRLTCALGSVAPDETRTITLQAQVDPGVQAGALLENDVFVTADTFDDNNGNNFDHALTTVVSEADLTVTKVAQPATATAGSPLQYLITVGNSGPSDAADVVVVDELPSGVSFRRAEVTVGAGSCLGLPSGDVTCQLGSLAVGATAQIAIEVLVDPAHDCAQDLVNTVTVTSPSDEDGATFILTTPIECSADLEIFKRSVPVKVFAGEQKRYTISVVNNGPSDAQQVLITDILPPETQYEINTGLCSASGQVVTCALDVLSVGAEFSFDIHALVKPDTEPGTTIENTATAVSATPDADDGNDSATSLNFVLQKADLKILKFGKPDNEVRAGEILTYTVIVDNLGPSYADGVAVKDVLQSSGTFDLLGVASDRDMECASTPVGAPGQVLEVGQLLADCELSAPLEVLESTGEAVNPGRWILTMTVIARQRQDLDNVAHVTSDAFLDPDLRNNSAYVEHAITEVADLSVEKTAPATVVAGETIEYELVVVNNGPSDAENVVLVDRLPPGISVTSAVAEGGECTTGAAGDPLDKLACGLGYMPEGSERTVTVVADVDPSVAAGAILENDAFVFSDAFDDDNSNDFAHTLTTVEARSVLAVTKVGQPNPVTAGTQLTYELRVENHGPSTLRNLQLHDDLQSGAEYLSFVGYDVENGKGACFYEAAGPPAVHCSLGDIPHSSFRVVYLRFYVAESTPPDTLLTNSATWEADSAFSFTEDSDLDETVELAALADLEVTKRSVPVKVFAGEQKRYTIEVTNHGPSDAVNVSVEDVLPGETVYEIDTGLCDEGGGTVTCHFGTIGPNQSSSVDVYALVNPDTPPQTVLLNTARTWSDTPDPNIGDEDSNNTAYSENLVLQKADLKVTKFGKEDGVVRAGEVLTYTAIVDNLGPSYADYAALKDVLQSSGEFDLVAIDSDREAICVGLPGPNPAVIVPASSWPIEDAPPPFGVDPATGVSGISQRLELDCKLTSALEVLDASGPPNPGRWILTLRVRARQAQDMDNVAVVTSHAYDPDTSNNQAYVEHEIVGVADLSVTKSALGENVVGCADGLPVTASEPNRVTAGLRLTYSIEVTNHGVADADNVVLYDRLPPGTVLVDGAIEGDAAAFLASCRTGTAGDAGDQLTCGLGTIAAQGDNTVRLTLVVAVDPALGAGTVLENDAFVTAATFDDDNSNNRASNMTTVNTSADLTLAKTHDPATVVAGKLVRYTLAIQNGGPSVARDVWVYDSLPQDVSFEGGAGGDCVEDPVNRGRVACSVGDLEPGQTAYVYLLALVDSDAPAAILDTAVVQSGFSDESPDPGGVTTPDPCPGDNIDTDAAPVIREADVYAIKKALSRHFVAGQEAAYQVTFGNLGPSTATSVTVDDALPDGFSFKRCEPIDPNDEVRCSGTGRDVHLESIERQNVLVYWRGGPLDPDVQLSFVVVADVDPGYLLDGLTDAGPGEIGERYYEATGYPFWAHNRVVIAAEQDMLAPLAPDAAVYGEMPQTAQQDSDSANNYDDEITRVIGLADLSIEKVDDLAGFLQCDPVAPGGTVTYDLFVTNNGPSDSAAVYALDWLPAEGLLLDPEKVEVEIEGDRGEVVEKRDDGRITVAIGSDGGQLGRLNAGETVHLTIRARVAQTARCGSLMENRAAVETIFDPAFPDGSTPTTDPLVDDNVALEETSIECASIQVRKTVSLDGQCPGKSTAAVPGPGQRVTFCLEITNTGTTWLDFITLTDTLRTRLGSEVIYTDTIRSGAAPGLPVAPGETVTRTVEAGPFDGVCGTVVNSVEVTAVAVNSGRTTLQCIPMASDSDQAVLTIPCAGADKRLQLPVIDLEDCETRIQIQNVGDQPAMAMMVVWGEAGACPPQAAGPLKTECTGLLGPGSAWSFDTSRLPVGSRSAIVYSMNATNLVPNDRGQMVPFGDLACRALFDAIVGSDYEWWLFDLAYRNADTYYTPRSAGGERLELDFGSNQGQFLAVVVNRQCPDPTDPNITVSAAYRAVSTDLEGTLDPVYGGHTYYAPLIFADQGGLTSRLWLHNSGDRCTSIEIWLKSQDNCLRSIIGDVVSLSPGESTSFDPSTVVGPGWIGSAWLRSSQPLGIVVDTLGANHFTSYTGVPGDVGDLGFSLGSQVNYAPLIYSEHQGWDTAIQVQNLSGVYAAKVKVYFLDRSGDVITTLIDWICPRGSQTFFLPLIDSIPGNWIGSARIESQEWVSPGAPLVDPPRVQSVVLLDKWADPQRSERREAVAYNALTEQVAFDWQLGAGAGGVRSGSAVLAVPLVAKQYDGITTELAITNLVPKPGFTDFAIFVYDQNGLVDVVCQKLNEKQGEYIDLATWGSINPRFFGSAVVSAVFWEHDVFDEAGQFERNLVGLGAVVVERIGGTLGGTDVPGDESKAFDAIPIFDSYTAERRVVCPGLGGR